MMRKQELLALGALIVILIGFPVSILAYERIYRPASYGEVKVVDLLARAPEAGGWSPDVIRVNRGDTVRLRITSPDVVHGFAIGRTGVDAGHIIPGEVTTGEFVADEVGRFTYYCNVWCSPSHYRMRGTLEVVDPASPDQLLTSTGESVAVSENLDIDAPHEARYYPLSAPSAVRGRVLADQASLPDMGDLHKQSPDAVFQAIRHSATTAPLSEDEIWDLVAYLWSQTTTPEKLEMGKTLYEKNCVGCHGESGTGDGPGARHLEHEATDFTAARTMAGGTSDIYYAKLLRGGMGTGMPYWGTILTEEETWSVVDYLWSLLFNASNWEEVK